MYLHLFPEILALSPNLMDKFQIAFLFKIDGAGVQVEVSGEAKVCMVIDIIQSI